MANPLFDRLFGRHLGKDTPFLLLEDGSTITHLAFLSRAAQFAHVIAQSGLKSGDRLAVQVEKSPAALALYAACAQSGVIYVPLNSSYTVAELAYFIEDSSACLVICDPKCELALGPIAKKFGMNLESLGAHNNGTFAIKADEQPVKFERVDRTGDDLAAFLYTSGTTGHSKGAMLTQNNLLSNATALANYWRFTESDVLLHALPIFHSHGLFVASNVTLIAGGSMIFLPKFDLDVMLEQLPYATTMMGVPTFYTRLLEDPRFTKNLADHMRLFISGSAPLKAETQIRFEQRTGQHILERYGMTETNMITSNPYDGERRAGTVGFPLPDVDLKITDAETGDTLASGFVGQIEIRGPNVFTGYWQMPEKTAAEFRADGFFVTGDLGKIDDDGYVHIVGRNKDLILSGGYNIYPKEVELVLDDQPGVLESAVIGVPHPDYGETVLGVIVPEIGQTPDLEAIMAVAGQSLARFKHPRKLVVLSELPRNTMGKVQKNQLREAYCDMFTVLTG